MIRLRTLLRNVAATALLTLAATAASQDLLLVHLADTHSAYDAYPRIVTAVKEIVAASPGVPVYVLFNGDIFELGNTVASRNAGELDWQFLWHLDSIAPVIVNIGNHEFDFMTFPEQFRTQAASRGIELIGGVASASSGALQPAYTTLPVADTHVTIVGLATNQMNTYPAAIRDFLLIEPPLDQMLALPDDLENLIVLSHAGVSDDVLVLSELDAANTILVVGAHDHLVIDTVFSGIPYQHNGFRGEFLRVTELTRAGDGWELSSRRVDIAADIAPDARLAKDIAFTRLDLLEGTDLLPVGTVPASLTVREAADWAVEALRAAVDADVALLNHTSFGSSLEQGPLSRYRFDEFIRFDNDVMVIDVDADTLATILSRANLDEDTPLEARVGDFVYATPVTVEPGRTYRLVTSSWVALDFNQPLFLGVDGLVFEHLEGVTTKGIIAAALR